MSKHQEITKTKKKYRKSRVKPEKTVQVPENKHWRRWRPVCPVFRLGCRTPDYTWVRKWWLPWIGCLLRSGINHKSFQRVPHTSASAHCHDRLDPKLRGNKGHVFNRNIQLFGQTFFITSFLHVSLLFYLIILRERAMCVHPLSLLYWHSLQDSASDMTTTTMI